MGPKRWRPSQRASLLPRGVGMVKPNHHKDILTTIWDNRDQLPFAWRILKHLCWCRASRDLRRGSGSKHDTGAPTEGILRQMTRNHQFTVRQKAKRRFEHPQREVVHANEGTSGDRHRV